MTETRSPCDFTTCRMEDFLADRLSPDEEERFRHHLAGCSACREATVEREPSLVFLDLAGQRKDEFFWAAMWRDIQDEFPARVPERRPRRRRLWAAAAVVLMALAGLTPLVWHGLGPGERIVELDGPRDPAPPLRVTPPRVTVEGAGVEVVNLESSMPIVMVYDKRIDL